MEFDILQATSGMLNESDCRPARLPFLGVMAKSRITVSLQSANPNGGMLTLMGAISFAPGPTTHSIAVSFAFCTAQTSLPI